MCRRFVLTERTSLKHKYEYEYEYERRERSSAVSEVNRANEVPPRSVPSKEGSKKLRERYAWVSEKERERRE